LSWEFDEHVQEKAAPFENICSQVVSEIIFDKGGDAGQGIGSVPDTWKNFFPPDGYGFVIDRLPDVCLAGKMTIEPALGEIGSCQDITDGGVVIALDRKKMKRFFDDVAFG
jgi:hypothetical protein